MKRIITLIVIAILITVSLFSKSGWIKQNLGVYTYIADVFFIDKDNGWSVGSEGVIRNTTNGGLTWNGQTSGTNASLNTVWFVDTQNGWAAGDGGKILKTTDAGLSWQSVSASNTDYLLDVQFFNTDIGWIATNTGKILKTTDAGLNWSQYNSGTSYISSICFIDSDTGWLSGSNGVIKKTTNGGISWQTQVTNTTSFLAKVQFLDQNNGFASGSDSKFLKTTNGGTTWQVSNIVPQSYVFSSFFVNTQTGWIGSFEGIFRTSNGGASWQKQTEAPVDSVFCLFFLNSKLGWATAGSEIYGTTTGGDTSNVIKADFTISKTLGYFPLRVNFTNKSTAESNATYLWNFGDGATLTDKNPIYTYTVPGTYTVSLIVTQNGIKDTATLPNVMVVLDSLIAAFHTNATEYPPNVGVDFYSDSRGSIKEYKWNFGEGNDINWYTPNPRWYYSKEGVYDVLLIVSDTLSSDTLLKKNYMTITSKVKAKFGASPLSGETPLTVHFVDSSSGIPANRIWFFGDGTVESTFKDKNAYHTYTEPGLYTVKLVVTNDNSTDSLIKTDYINIKQKLIADFDSDTTSGRRPLRVQFRDRSKGNIDRWYWHFGDGDTSTLQNPVHYYGDPGAYTVRLLVGQEQYIDTITKFQYVDVADQIFAWISQNSERNEDITSVKFVNKSNGFALAGKYLIYTTNGGAKWNLKYKDPATNPLNDIYFLDNKMGWIAGNYSIWRTRDGGTQWEESLFENLGYINNIVFVDTLNGFITGSSMGKGKILRTTNGGKGWGGHDWFDITVGFDLPANLTKIKFLDTWTGYIGGENGFLIKTTDRGSSWQKLAIPFDNPEKTTITGISLINNNKAVICGYDTELGTGMFFITNDAGISWLPVSLPYKINYLKDIWFTTESDGFAITLDQYILTTKDGGYTWEKTFYNQISSSLISIFFQNESDGWITGSNGLVLSTKTGGYTDIRELPVSSLNGLNIIPVPATDYIDVQLDKNSYDASNLTIFNSLGDKVQSINIQPNVKRNESTKSGTVRIEILNLPNGIYYLKIGRSTGVFIKK